MIFGIIHVSRRDTGSQNVTRTSATTSNSSSQTIVVRIHNPQFCSDASCTWSCTVVNTAMREQSLRVETRIPTVQRLGFNQGLTERGS